MASDTGSHGALPLLDRIPHRVFSKNRDLIYTYANSVFAADSGHTPEEVIGKSDYELFPVDLAEKYRSDDLRIMESGENLDVVEEFDSLGKRLFIRTLKRTLTDESGLVSGIMGMFWDITGELEDKSALEASQTWLRMAQDVSGTGSWYWEQAENAFHMDKQTSRIFFGETDRTTCPLPTLLELIYPTDRMKTGARIKEILSGKDNQGFAVDYRIKRPGGTIQYIHTRGETVHNPRSGTSRIAGLAVDVTSRGRTEDALKTILAMNRNISASTLDGIMELGLEESVRLTDSRIGFFHLVDEASGEISLQKWSADTMKICQVDELDQHYPVEAAGIWVECIKQRRPVVENDYSTANGKKGLPAGHFPLIRFLTVPIFQNDKVVAIIGVGNKDIEYDRLDMDQLSLLGENIWSVLSRKRAENDLAEAHKEALNANRVKDRFFSIVAHDLTGPVSNIRILVEQLELLGGNEEADPETLANITSILRRSVENAGGLLRDLLDWSRSQRNTIAFAPKEINCRTATESAVRICRDMASSKNIEIAVDGDLETQVCADANMLKTILRNLLMNAVKFTQRGGRIGIAYSLDGDETLFRIHDNGIGIEAERINGLFDLGTNRSTRGTEHERGTGLGLVLCREFVDRHNGSISVESTPGEGSTFTVRFATCDDSCGDES